ncbi:nucleotide-binding alpha-beta plait domain-containing protein [Tanacetum coccineum]
MSVRRSKEDETQKISTSIFVTNFSDSFNAKDLWRVCNQYGTVIDTFIPNRRSKSDKIFGFVRFIKVANVQWLVTNLCTIWVGSFRLQANVARFQRKPLNQNTDQPINKKMNSHGQGEVPKENMFAHNSGSFARTVKKGINIHQEEVESKPALVLDDYCLNIYDLSTALMGKVKVFNSLSNLKLVLTNEGFANIKLKYIGGLWVLIKFHANSSKEKFMANTSVVSWFSHLQQASNNVFTDERITWLDIEDTILESFKIIIRGKVFWIRAKEAGGWTPDFMEEDKDESVYDDVVSKEGNHEANEGQNNPNSLGGESDVEEARTHSDDPFSIYDLLKKKKDNTESDSDSDNKMQYPSGFTPSFNVEEKSNDMNVQGEKDEHHSTDVQEEILSASETKEKSNNTWNEGIQKLVSLDSVTSKDLIRTGGSMLQVMEDMVKVGQMMGYNMKGCINNIEDIIKSQGAKEDFRLILCLLTYKA